MLSLLSFPPPYPPGFEPPQLSFCFCVASVLFVVVSYFLSLCLAALQIERQRLKTPRNQSTAA
jgi:hypothetical protein